MGLSVGCVWNHAGGRAAARFIKGLSGAHASAGRDGGEDLTPSTNPGGDWHSRKPRLPGLHTSHPSPPSASHWPGAYSCWRRLVTGLPPPNRVRRAASWSHLVVTRPGSPRAVHQCTTVVAPRRASIPSDSNDSDARARDAPLRLDRDQPQVGEPPRSRAGYRRLDSPRAITCFGWKVAEPACTVGWSAVIHGPAVV